MNDVNKPPPKPIEEVLGLNQKNKHKPRKLMLWLVAAGIVVVWVFLKFHGSDEQKSKYVTQPVTRGDLEVTVSATGTLAPLKEVSVGIEVSGTIKSVEADYNDTVKVGQVLAQLDTRRLEAQTTQSQAALESARAKIQQTHASVLEAEIKLARMLNVQKLSGGKVPAQYDLDTAKATLARAKADEAAAKAAADQAQAALNVNRTDLNIKAVIKSPINGVVLKRLVEPGQTVASQFQAPVLFTLAEDLTKMELQIDVDEADVGLVHPGQKAQFTVDAYPDQSFPAEITLVRYGSQTLEGVVTYKTVLRVDNSSLSLRPGMTATAVITVEKKTNVLQVANSALRFTPPPPPKAEEEKTSVLGMLLPHPPRTDLRPPAPQDANSKTQQVWTERNGVLTPITITKGATNGAVTEIVDGDVKEGTELISAQAGKL